MALGKEASGRCVERRMSQDGSEAFRPERILVTGANGFIGRHLLVVLRDSAYQVLAAVRRLPQQRVAGVDYVPCGSIDADTDWRSILPGADCIVHLAAHVHVVHARPEDGEAFQQTNVQGSLCLARAALRHSVRRFVYISSIKVNGEESGSGAFSADDPMRPQDGYARSKAETEKALLKHFAGGPLQIVIVRPPLVYGRGVRGNLRLLARAIAWHLPLPFASVNNRRSLVSVLNLCDLIRVCCYHPNAAGETFLASDDSDLSTPQLIRFMARAMQRRAVLLPCPMAVLRFLSRVPPFRSRLPRLLGNLRLDLEKTKRLLDWSPPYAAGEGLQAMTTDA